MKRVYFIKPIGLQGPIKIGCSSSPEGRQSALESWSPFALEIVAAIEGGFDLERRFHAHFIDTHDRREWFGWSRKLQETIEQISAGTFDTATLPEPLVVSPMRRGTRRSWTDEERARASLSHKARAVRDRTDQMLPHGINTYDIGRPGHDHVRKAVENYISDPFTYGVARDVYFAHWNSLKAARQSDTASPQSQAA